ncbi:Filamentous hemagglutinin family outer membrane protein [Paraburkholderia ribeironis]|uniref:Filamentous hemagglutinin family outer membrane protein n=1 Tax=Paraburkholderia ribeironis TaxID=1247936 RepID=A0A1N7RL94_9BURK|nr:hemagglutinin repeat-containing protein [Paraburkholderia ribeironis]SIT35880.1 Filamentous hemagglutinin family outer membrane protein [Paraburkholderia ribeironis]
MNKNTFRLVYSRLRGMLVAVAETAIAHGNANQGETRSLTVRRSITLFAMRHTAFAVLALCGLAPVLSDAQIVPSGAHAPNVISTANGLPQVNITKPSSGGVSLNTYSQFDVSPRGAILNNSPLITGTQLAGQINGNPNFGPNDAAKIIVNQVNSNNPSLLRGYVEVAGQKAAAVVIANSSGLVVDGGGFINTSRGILTTGNPIIDGSGNLTGFNVTGGLITVQGAGLNALNIDEVDLLSRAVQANAAIYGNTLHVVTGSNSIDYASLNPTPIAGNGAAPGVSIDVSQLGGMYSGRIILVGTENGVGVANAGTIAAQAGDLTLTSSGQLVQTGTMKASGNIGINAAGVANSGTIYAQQNTTIGSSGMLTNNGTLAAQQNTAVNAGAVASTGTLGAGVNNDGSVGNSGNLNVSATGQLNATGENVAGGNASLSGSGVNLAGSETAANGNVSLTANAGDLNLVGATTSAGGSVVANATGTLDNDNGSLTGGGVTLNAGNLSNQGGDISAQGPLVAQASGQLTNQGGSIVSQGAMQVSGGAIANNQGTIQSAAGLSVAGVSLDNTAGRITSLNSDGLSVTTTGRLVNAAGTTATGAQGGVIGGNGAVTLQGSTIANHGTVSAQTNLQVTGQSVDNSGGSLDASGNTTVNAGSHLTNSGGSIAAGQTVTESATTLDNSSGTTQAAQVSLNATNLVNHAGTITQTGSGPMNVAVSGTLDNSAGGTLQTNSTDLTLAPATLDNDGGKIVHAGTGTLTLDAGSGAGAISNAGGTIQSNGQVVAQAGTFGNAAGLVLGQTGLTATVGNALDNTNGKLLSNTELGLVSGSLANNGGQIGAASTETIQSGSLTNNGGSIVAPHLALAIGSTLDNSGGTIQANQLALSATDLLNHGGTITQYGASPMSVNVSNTLDNSNGGTIQTNSTDLTLAPATLDNDGGTILAAGTGTLTIAPGNPPGGLPSGRGSGSFSNVGGKIIAAGQLVAQAGSLNNATGVLAAQGNIAANVAGNINNTQGAIRSLASLSLASGGALANTNGQIQSGTGAAGDASTLAIQAASIDNTGGLVSNLGTGNTTVQGGSQIINSGGAMTGNGNVAVDTSSLSNTQGGQLSGASVAVQADTVDNSGGKIGSFAGSTGDVAITTTGAITNTNGQIGATHDLTLNAAALTGGGAYSATNDVAVNVQGNFAPTPDLQFSAGHDLTFTLPGTFSNSGTLQAVDNLNVNASDIENSGSMMAGGTLTTHSNTLENTGAIVGGSVSLNAAQSITNVGPTALIGATDSKGLLELLAPDIENRDDTTMTDTQATTAIYGLGKVVLAGGKDANGNYTNANLIRNQSALIQSAGDMTLDASQVTNTRTTMTTTGLNQAVDPALITQFGISLSGCTAIDMTACSAGNPNVGWTTPNNPAFLTMIGGVYTVPPNGGQWNSGYQYTTYTGVAVANLIASISPQAQIIAGGNLDASKVGLFQNQWSAVAAVGNIAAPITLDQNSWQGQAAPEVQVTYSGYYHYTNYDHSIADWTLPFGNAPFVGSNPGGYQAAPADIRSYALPSYESSFVAGGTLSGTGVNINNTAGNAGVPSLGLVPGQSPGGVSVGGVSGNAGGSKGGTASVNSGSGPVNPVIASATAVNVLSNLTIPQGGLFRPDTAPNAPYLIETNPAFTSQKSFISSDYYLQQLGLNPQSVEKRLGDGLYEQQLVQNEITSLTGKAVLGPYTDVQSMYEALLAAGASLAQSLDLPLGMSLSPDQVAALTSNVIIMQTEVVDGQSVLVPVVYLAKASQQNMNGPLIAATDIDLQNAQTFNNSGTVQAGNTLSIQGQQINNAFGTLQSGGLMSLATTGNVNLTSATVNAGSLALNAGGDLLLNTAANTVNQVSATGATRTTTTLGPIANLNVTGNAAIVTGGNFEQNGGNLNVGGNLGMAVGGNYDLGSVQTGEHKVVAGANGVSDTSLNRTTGSSVNVGGVSQIGVGGNLTATGANINLGGGGTVVAKGDVTLQAAKATSTVDSNSSGSDSHGSYSASLHTSADTLTATTLNSGNSLTVASGHDINLTGSTINLDQGTATLAAANNVNIGAATATYVDNSQEQHSHSNVVSGKEVSSSSNTTTTLSQGSMISADGVSITSGKDINVAGSTIVGTHDVSLSAVHDVNITTTQDTSQSSSSYEEKKSGFGAMSGGGVSLNYGTSDTQETTHDSSVTNNGSLVGSTNGNLTIQAGNTLHVTGSDLVAAQNVTGTAANVIIDAATSTSHHDDTQETKQSGFTLGLSGSVGDAINGAVSQGQALASGNSNGRAEALHAIAAVGDSAIAGAGLMGGSLGGQNPSIGVQLSFGSNQSKNTFTEDQTTQKGSNVQAGGTAAFVATGDGTPGSGNLTIAGSDVSANDVVLAAKNQVNIVNTTNTDTTASTNKSSSASVGVSYGTQGFGVSASMSNAHGDANSDAAIQNASHVSGANSVTVVSGGDTNIIGSQVSGGQVTANVGGNLNIESVQDTTVSTAHQSSAGGGFSISQGGGSASFSAQNGHADSNYAQVNEQAGIQAGSGGFDVNVKGNTNLTGAVISSTADPSQNSLTTGTLTYSDIQNQSHYDATSNGISAGVGVGNTGKALGPGSVSGTGGVSPTISQNESGDSSATTRSAISAGSINITNQAAQTQDVSTLSRDTTNTNGTVSATPDVNNLLSQQADTMQAAQAAGQVVAQGIGAYANAQQKAAQDQADAAKAADNTDLAAQYQAEADSWAEGGTNRVGLHVVGGALIGGLGGGSVFSTVGGAAGAGVSATLPGKLNSVADSIGGATGSMTVGNTVSNVLAGLSGALVGGTAGAFTASNADLYNRDTTNANGTGGTGSQALDKALQYAKDFGQAALNLVPGKQMADQAQTAFANGNYGMGAALAVGSVADAAMGVLTAGESKAVSSTVEAAVEGGSSAVRTSVLNNIADSQAARSSSNFDVFLARSDQVQWGYAADQWATQTLPAGSLVYGGLPGQSAYYTTEQALIDSGYSKTSLFQSLQVSPHPEFGYRPQMGVYQVTSDINVPAGTVSANPALGSGGATQFFIKNFQSQLNLIDKVNLGK